MKKQFKNIDDLYAHIGAYFYQFGRWEDYLSLRFDEKNRIYSIKLLWKKLEA